jgi:hypothetical protein
LVYLAFQGEYLTILFVIWDILILGRGEGEKGGGEEMRGRGEEGEAGRRNEEGMDELSSEVRGPLSWIEYKSSLLYLNGPFWAFGPFFALFHFSPFLPVCHFQWGFLSSKN